MAGTESDAAGESVQSFRGLTLFPFQREALSAILSGQSVVVAAPTGAGKTLVADYAIERALVADRRVVYTSPIKALSNQKFRDFRAHYGEDRVGIMTGDVTIHSEAPLLVMTTEIFRNTIFEAPERLRGFDFVIFDEVHYLDDRERGTVWEESIIYAPRHIRVVALSATVPNVEDLAAWIAEVRATEVRVIVEHERPVPLTHRIWVPGRGPRALPEVKRHYVEMGRAKERGRGGRRRAPSRSRRAQEEVLRRALGSLVDHLEERDLLPAICFCFSRADCEALAEDHARRHLLEGEDLERMLRTFDDLAARYEVSDARETLHFRSLAERGVLFHHAGMLPIDKEIVERLFTTGLVRLLFATETFSLGVNMPARTVVFQSLCKFDGIRYGRIMAREYWQMAGRAGRQGIDAQGHVFALLDETSVDWPDVEYLLSGRIEPVRSRFDLSYGGILNLHRRLGDQVEGAWQHSFARFQREGRRGAPGAGQPKKGAGQIRARLQVLRAEGYLDEQGLTEKGALCARVNGYEIAVTEAYANGWLARADPVQLVMLFAAMVYDPRPQDHAERPTRSMKGLAVPFAMRMEAFAAEEAAAGVSARTRPPDFGIAGPVQRFAEGADFDDLLGRTSLAAGDLVRVLRMTIQMLRQAAHALPADDPCVQHLEEARARIDRDVVDARRQLELG
jgi:superfamily II RNA helicase